jgi:cell division control protein 6
VIRNLTQQSKLVLLSVLLNEKTGRSRVITGEIYETYTELCRKLSMNKLSQRRVSDLISELDMLGIINARVVSFGGKRPQSGRTKLIHLAVPPRSTEAILSEDEMLAPVVKYKPPSQSTLM